MRLANTYPTVGTDRDGRVVLPCLYALFWAFVFLRFVLNANLLDEIVDYRADGGSIVEKIHPSTYGIVFVLIATVLSTPIALDKWEFRALRSLLAFASTIAMIAAFVLLLGHSGSIGYLVDTYVVACAAGALMLCFPEAWREWLGTTLLIFISAGALMALGEFALQTRLLPYRLEELSFRATGLSEHPLVLGLFNVVGINFVAASRWKAITKSGVIILLLLGTLAAGARVASMVAAASVLGVIALYKSPSKPPRTRVLMKVLLLSAILVAIPAVLATLIQFGLLERFQNGLIDESAMARVDIYGLFNLVTWNDILFGADIAEIRNLASEHFDLKYLESPIVFFIFQFGLLGTIVFLLFMARMFLVLISGSGRHVVVGTWAFFIVASTNNSLSTKSPIILMIVLLIVAFHGTNPGTSTGHQ